MSEWSEWREGTLAEIAEIIMGQSPEGESCNTNRIGSPLLNGPTEFGIKYPIPIQFTVNPRKFSKPNDILFCVRGSTTGRMNWADEIYALGRGLAAIRHKNGQEYKYFVRGIIDFNLPNLLSSATGSTFPNVSRNQIEELEISIPPLPEQKAIAAVLSSLDDKIDLLHRQNKTLEAMAETLFRQWFVVDAQDNWEEGKLGDEFSFTMGQSPLGSSFNDGFVGVPMFQGNADFGFRFPSERVFTTEPTRFAQKFDTLISVRAPVGAQNMAHGKCCIGRGVAAFRYTKNKDFSLYMTKK
jgi:type I restriction enzyme S subunit